MVSSLVPGSGKLGLECYRNGAFTPIIHNYDIHSPVLDLCKEQLILVSCSTGCAGVCGERHCLLN